MDDDDSIISVPVVEVIDESAGDNGETVVKGAFWVYNYKIDGDTLKCVSGGAHPGAMHVVKDDDGDEYEVLKFDAVGDGSQFEPTAKEIFGDKYEDFMKYDSDDKAQEALRGEDPRSLRQVSQPQRYQVSGRGMGSYRPAAVGLIVSND